MSALSDLITKYTDISNAEIIYDDLTSKTNSVIIYDGDQSIAAIEKVYGQQFAIALVMGMKSILDALNSSGTTQDIATASYLSIYFDRVTKGSGLNFADLTVHERLDSLSPYLTQSVVDKLKAMGRVMKSKWEIYTSEPQPTLEEVTEEINLENSRRKTKIWVEYVKNGILANNGNGKSISELKLLIAERE